MKYLIIFSALAMVLHAQRPSYASSGPIGRPGLASRFKDDNATSSTSTTVSFENRVGDTSSTPKIPVDARGDVDLVNTLNSWDRQHQPFWFINADHIEKARNTTRPPQTGQSQSGQNIGVANRNQIDSQGNRGSFLGAPETQGNRGSLSGSSDNQGNRGSLSGSADNQGNRGSFSGSSDNQGNRGNFSGSAENQANRGSSLGSQDNFQGNEGYLIGQDALSQNQNRFVHKPSTGRLPSRPNGSHHREGPFGVPSQGETQSSQNIPAGFPFGDPNHRRQFEGNPPRFNGLNHRNNFYEFY